jgi:methyl-accepting chemotaxis protein
MAERAGTLLEAMQPSIARTSTLVQHIAQASGEQAESVTQINGTMAHVNGSTQQNASAAEQLSATAEELSAQAAQLQELMGFFRLGTGARGPGVEVTRQAGPRAAAPAALSRRAARAQPART